MQNFSNIDVNGQLLFIEPTGVTGETCLFSITNPIDYAMAKAKVTEFRKRFIEQLEEQGFVITYDRNNCSKDIVYFIMNPESICAEEISFGEYKKKYDKALFEACEGKLNYPYSLNMEEYFESPFFPAVFKNELMNGGKDKFLIETEEQLEIIKKFYNAFKNKPQYKDAFDVSIFQQLIKTPTQYKTYMRVLMSASGDVMGASLKYSRPGYQQRLDFGMFEKYLRDKNSEYFLNAKEMFNYYSGGGEISFAQPRYSYEKQEILKAHGIDSENPTIPQEVLEVSYLIATKCNNQLGIMCGIDFIFDEKDKKWYYLEVQGFPAIDEYLETKRLKTPKVNNANDYVKLLEVELEVRYIALMMCMKKKLEAKNACDETFKQKIKYNKKESSL